MPYIEAIIDPAPTAELATRLADAITDAMASVVGKRREVTAVRIIGSDALIWTIDAKMNNKTTAYLDVKITEGTNSSDEKASLITLLHQILSKTFGELEEASYIVIHELPAENWGFAGLTQANRAKQRGAYI
ncbi:MAG: tautomerase family protein [Candidatus Thiodiazotropha sp. LLP2]